MPASELNLVAPINVTEEAETKAVLAGRISEAVNGETGRGTVESVANSRVRLVVVHWTPVVRLLVGHWGVRRVIDGYVV